MRKSYGRLRKAAIGISISRGIYYNKLKKLILLDTFALLLAYQQEEAVSTEDFSLLHQMDEMGKVFEAIENVGDELADEMNRYDNPTTKVDIYRGKPVFALINAARRFRQAWLYAKETNDIEVTHGQAG